VAKSKKSWSLTVGTVRNIPIRIHYTFFILLGWLLLDPHSKAPLSEAIFVILIFTCVLLHELGHALMAHRFSIKTRDITLYPFGGIASISTQPEPRAELFIALAGPLVNVVIAVMLYLLMEPTTFADFDGLNLVHRLFITNVALVLFNLLPALPMDGGRVLRSILALLSVKNATKISARISQGLCIILGLIALYVGLPILFIISLLIFLGAMQEHLRAESKIIASEFAVEDAYVPKERLESLTHGITVSRVLPVVLTSWQTVFPVLNGEEFLGITIREDILTLAATRSDDYIGEITQKNIPQIDVTASLSEAYSLFEKHDTPALQVLERGVYRGLLVQDRIPDLIVMHEIRQKLGPEEEIQWPISS
jgi:stage IV sporulation protein FB